MHKILGKRHEGSYDVSSGDVHSLQIGLGGGLSFEPVPLASVVTEKIPLLLRLNGKKLAIFGSSPDMYFSSNPQGFRSFVNLEQIKRVLLLDTRRLSMPICKDLSSVSAQNILDHYENFGIPVLNEWRGRRFDLTDKEEIADELQNALIWGREGELLEKLETGCTLGDAFKEIGVDKHSVDRFYALYKWQVLPPGASDEAVGNLVYYPHPWDIYGFIQQLYEGYKISQLSYVHCAAGHGRTGLYLTCVIMFIKKCDFATAMKDVDAHYSLTGREIYGYKSSADKFYEQFIKRKV